MEKGNMNININYLTDDDISSKTDEELFYLYQCVRENFAELNFNIERGKTTFDGTDGASFFCR